jgi:hypothetical protein
VDHLAARVGAAALDGRLAAGHTPESSFLLATRAHTLVSPEHRRALAGYWEHLLEESVGRRQGVIRRVPLCRSRIAEAEPAVRDMIGALVSAAPLPARGVAMASALLRDGAGPLYNQRCSTDLGAAVRDATHHMNPSVSLVSSS